MVDAFAGFVWSSARAVTVSAQVTEELFRISWLRLADHVTELPHDAVEPWLQQTITRERTRMLAIRRGGLG
jgi:hypothetical protein